jgi:predicted nucleic acid-binding protein
MLTKSGIIADTCFWLAAFDPKDGNHKAAANLLEQLVHQDLLMPWPIMYETLRTRTVKNPTMMAAFEHVISRPRVIKIDDSKYRIKCLETAFVTARNDRPISLVDLIVRAVLEDTNYHITQLITYNERDFEDVCHRRGIPMSPS